MSDPGVALSTTIFALNLHHFPILGDIGHQDSRELTSTFADWKQFKQVTSKEKITDDIWTSEDLGTAAGFFE